ncbi:rho guanine nucleotide exchange factor 6-like [Rhincodon typus]|uniref:rho guanine nucleotide exchange factor 6-like n=1 Tax=Rhincodon typus TaxID=259920 RepID=UPI00202E2FE7|nr:rho guanine nucleotide exchange factor 6-like [Rhincodon typus]
MTPAEQNVTWLISLGVLESPKKTISDPEEFLLSALRDGLVLCKLIERLVPGSVDKVCPEPRTESESCSNIREFLRGCSALHLEQTFDVNDLYKGLNFNKVLSTLSAINKATEERGRTCPSFSSHHSNSATSVSSSQAPASKASRALRRPSKNLEMTENGSHQLVVKAKFNFKQTNEDELSFSKGDILYVTRVEDGGWWEGSLKGKSGWFPSNYVREIKPSDKPLSPKSLKGFETPSVTKNYYSLVVQNILDNERDYAKELQVLLNTYLRSLQANDKLSAADIGALKGNLEEICSFQQTLYQTLEECTKLPDSQQKVGGCFLNLMPQMKSLYLTYCANHPSAVNVLTEHRFHTHRFETTLFDRSTLRSQYEKPTDIFSSLVPTGTAALEEDAQILKVIEAYCTSANLQQTHSSVCRKESAPQVLLPEEEKIIVEETKSNGQTVIEEKSLVDTVYALKDEVQELKQENKRMKQSLEEEQKSRKELEKMIRKVLKQLNESAWDEGNH